MKYVYLYILIVLPNFAFADDSEMQKYLGEYLVSFSKSENLSHYFVETPHFIFGDHLMSPKSAVEASEFVLDIRSKLKEKSYENSEILKYTMRMNIDSISVVSLLLQRYKSGQRPLDRVCSTYGIIKGESGYSILSWQPSSPNNNGECE